LIPSATAPQTNSRTADQAWIIQQPIRAIGTDWILECTLPASAGERRSTMALLFGLTVTALMTGLLLLLAGRTRRIEAEVETRTDELRIANRQLEENIRERIQLEEEMSELSAREQRRIGRDLHDSLGQKLTGAVFLSRSLLNWLKEHSAQRMEHSEESPGYRLPALDIQRSHAQTLNETLKSAVAQVRNMARGLASVTLNDESLEESLHQLTEEMGALYNIPCELKQNGTLPALDRKTKEQLYFIAREAVNNAARHAGPAMITIQLFGEENHWSLRIEDNGAGLPEENRTDEVHPVSGGMGLRIMRHRANLIGAQFTIQSTPGDGTTIELKYKT
jgi:signal transduction histidine kinase